MATTNTPRVRATKLGVSVTHCGGATAEVYLTPTGFKLGAKGRVHTLESLGQWLDKQRVGTTARGLVPAKGDLRRLRKALRAAGRVDLVHATL